MNLKTTYLGLKLESPLIVGASPFCDDIDMARRLQEVGAAALVMRSLFEEQIDSERDAPIDTTHVSADNTSPATSSFPHFSEYQLSAARYLRQLEQLRSVLTIPIIGSLNGSRPGAWTDYAVRMEAAGANAIELNLYRVVTDPGLDASNVESEMLETVGLVTSAVRIPVAVKMSPFHTSLPNFAIALERSGVKGVVLFNRFYQPDFDLGELEVRPELKLSEQGELLLRLRWLAILSPHLRGSIAATGGVHSADDVIKALLAGAHAVQVVSVLLRSGPRAITSILGSIGAWMNEYGYSTVEQFRGALNLRRCPDPAAFERGHYQRILQSWRV